nr:metallophosphoesterase [Deinococcus peraridilitoris]
MRLAIIADVHGNKPALDAVLADVRLVGADRLIVNGDVVNRGPDGVAVMEDLLAQGAQFTLGNHDALMNLWHDRDPEIPTEWFHDPFFASFSWCANELSRAGLLQEFTRWPMTLRVDVPGAPSVVVAHGTPDHYREGIGRRMSEARMGQLLDESAADVLVGSHTHVPGEWRLGSKLLINTGAVGAPFNRDARAQYLLLRLQGDCWQPEIRFVPYDLSAVLRNYEESGLLSHGGLSAHIFREELPAAYPIYARFWEWVEGENRAKDWNAWREFERIVLPQYGLTPVG